MPYPSNPPFPPFPVAGLTPLPPVVRYSAEPASACVASAIDFCCFAVRLAFPTPAPVDDDNYIYISFVHASFRKGDVHPLAKNIASVTGKLATEIFLAPVFFAACELNRLKSAFTSSDSVARCFCKGRGLPFTTDGSK